MASHGAEEPPSPTLAPEEQLPKASQEHNTAKAGTAGSFRDFSLEAVEGDSTVNLRNASEENFEPPAPSQALSIASSVTEIESYDGNLCSPPKIDVRNSPANRDPDVDDQNSEASPRPRSRGRDNMLMDDVWRKVPEAEGSQVRAESYQSSVTEMESWTGDLFEPSHDDLPPQHSPNRLRGDDASPEGTPSKFALARRGLPSKQSPTPEYSDEEYRGMPPPPSTSKALGWGDSESRPQPHQDSSITSIPDLVSDDSQLWTPRRVQRVLVSLREERGIDPSQNDEFMMMETPIREFFEIEGLDDESQVI